MMFSTREHGEEAIVVIRSKPNVDIFEPTYQSHLYIEHWCYVLLYKVLIIYFLFCIVSFQVRRRRYKRNKKKII